VGASDEPGHIDAAPGSGREHLPDLRVRGTGEALVGSPRQSTNIPRRRSSAKYVAPWMRGSTMLPSVHGAPPGWRTSSRVEGFPRSFELRNHRVRSRCVMGTFDPHPATVSCRGSASSLHLSKASLAFSPACLRLLLV
jgi:hypothetical protein